MEQLVINGRVYVPQESTGDIKIVIAQRGFVYVGRVEKNGTQVTIRNAHCIRRWGTTKGLGQIATGGPTESTTLDHAGTVEIHELGIVASILCDQPKWEGVCK